MALRFKRVARDRPFLIKEGFSFRCRTCVLAGMIFCMNPLFGQEYDWGSLQQYSRALTTDIKSLEVLKDSMLLYDNNDFAKSTAYGLALLNRPVQNKPILFWKRTIALPYNSTDGKTLFAKRILTVESRNWMKWHMISL